MFCHICKSKMSLSNKKEHYGRVFKEYRCVKGHRKDIEKDKGVISIKEYIVNGVNTRKVYV